MAEVTDAQIDSGPAIIIRDLTPEDHGFIYNSWLQSYATSEFARPIPRKIYFVYHHAAIERILKRGAKVDVACLADDPTFVVGYVCHESGTLHYVYVKELYRRAGVAGRLIGGVKATAISHLSLHPAVSRIRRKLGSTVSYVPYFL